MSFRPASAEHRPAPIDVDPPALNSTIQSLAAHFMAQRGSTTIVLECFAAWCTHCQALTEPMKAVYNDWSSLLVPLFAIDAAKAVSVKTINKVETNLQNVIISHLSGYPTVLKITYDNNKFACEKNKVTPTKDNLSRVLIESATTL